MASDMAEHAIALTACLRPSLDELGSVWIRHNYGVFGVVWVAEVFSSERDGRLIEGFCTANV
jgi:hypothetical protein